MISFLRGKIINKAINYLILDVNDIGYQVYMGESLLNELKMGREVEIYTFHNVREDTSALYGFKSINDLEFFEMLISVSGVGPKSALGVLSTAVVEDVKESIVRGDATLLTKVSGIGKKTAERVVLELKNKVTTSGVNAAGLSINSFGGDEIDALMSLGYSLSEARNSLNMVDPATTSSSARVREALKNIGK